ncbi:hypothetical protein BYT27DRAFT_7333939 [Phlegmacium glaucopus]|nr:hypothetical protein BYT27DRAFT_7333939 [Phlegmacium glaucopus]
MAFHIVANIAFLLIFVKSFAEQQITKRWGVEGIRRYLDLRLYGVFIASLFKPMAFMEDNASELDVLLYQMILFCGEFFEEDFLQRCPRSLDYFQLDCRPKKFRSFVRKPFEKCILDAY